MQKDSDFKSSIELKLDGSDFFSEVSFKEPQTQRND